MTLIFLHLTFLMFHSQGPRNNCYSGHIKPPYNDDDVEGCPL